MALTIEPLTKVLGVEISGVNLADDIDDATFGAIEDAFNTHGVLVFRDQSLEPDVQVAFSRRFGALDVHVFDHWNHRDHPEILVVSNVKENDEYVGIHDAGRYWHTDLSYMDVPSRGSMLHAIEIPTQDGKPLGDTLFASTAAAYDALPEEKRGRIDGLEAVYSLAHRHAKLIADGNPDAVLADDHAAKTPEVVHRIVQHHPVTGRPIIYVNEGHTARVVGMAPDEGRALLDNLCAFCTRPEFVYRHTWRVGDVVMWDNIQTQHIALNDYTPAQRRYLHRTTLSGSPIA